MKQGLRAKVQGIARGLTGCTAVLSGLWLLLCLVLPLTARAEAAPELLLTEEEARAVSAHPVLRVVADPAGPPLSVATAEGEAEGLLIDILGEAAARLGIWLKFVPASTWEAALGTFSSGEADLIVPLSRNPEREARFAFSGPLATFTPVIYARREQAPVSSLSDLAGQRLAQVAGTAEAAQLRADYPDIEVLEFADSRSALEAIAARQADATVGSPAVFAYVSRKYLISGLTAVGQLPQYPRRYTLGLQKELAPLGSALDKAVEAIPESRLEQLRARWLPDAEPGATLELTENERAWLAAHPVVTFGVNQFPPLIFEGNAGEVAGVTAEFVGLIAQKLGLRVEWKRYASWPEELAALFGGELDVVPSLASNATLPGSISTHAYMSLASAIVTRRDESPFGDLSDLSDRIVVVQRNAEGLESEILRGNSQQPILRVDTMTELLDAVVSGKADAGVGTLAVIDYALRNDGYGRSLKIAGRYKDFQLPVSMVVKPQDELLASVLNKGIDSLTDAERQAILQRWFNNAPSGLDPVQVLRWALTIGLPIFVGSLFVSYWIVRLRREIRERKRLQRKLDHLLEQTSSRLSGVMENSPAAIWAKDRSGHYLFANEAFRTFHRVPTDLSIVDRTDLELFDPGTAYAFRENDELVAASGNSVRVVEQIGFGEDAAHVLSAKFPLRGPTGEIEAIGGVAIDVTEQLRLQTRLSQVNQALVARENILLKLSSERIFDDGDMAAGFRAVTSAITAILEVQRASVWMLADAGETLVCQWLHDTVRGASDEAITLSRCDFEVYFAAIKGSRTLLAPDAHEDSRTACFSESYLRPHGIGAMLDVSIRHHGETVGVICCEHGPGRREWGDEDASFVGALADLLARALTARERQVALAQLQELNVTLEQRVKERTAEAEAARSAAETSR